jgi:hypothetical protein
MALSRSKLFEVQCLQFSAQLVSGFLHEFMTVFAPLENS